MRVLHVSPAYEPAWAFGPMPGRIAALARAQAALGDRVTVLTTDAIAPHERAPVSVMSEDGVRVVRLRNLIALVGDWFGLSTPIGIRAQLTSLVGDADVVHCHGLRTIETGLASRARPRTSPLVLSPHANVGARGPAAGLWNRVAGSRVLRRIDLIAAWSADELATTDAIATHRGTMLKAERMIGLDGDDRAVVLREAYLRAGANLARSNAR